MLPQPVKPHSTSAASSPPQRTFSIHMGPLDGGLIVSWPPLGVSSSSSAISPISERPAQAELAAGHSRIRAVKAIVAYRAPCADSCKRIAAGQTIDKTRRDDLTWLRMVDFEPPRVRPGHEAHWRRRVGWRRWRRRRRLGRWRRRRWRRRPAIDFDRVARWPHPSSRRCRIVADARCPPKRADATEGPQWRRLVRTARVGVVVELHAAPPKDHNGAFVGWCASE